MSAVDLQIPEQQRDDGLAHTDDFLVGWVIVPNAAGGVVGDRLFPGRGQPLEFLFHSLRRRRSWLFDGDGSHQSVSTFGLYRDP
jgi:hypothetical protein